MLLTRYWDSPQPKSSRARMFRDSWTSPTHVGTSSSWPVWFPMPISRQQFCFPKALKNLQGRKRLNGVDSSSLPDCKSSSRVERSWYEILRVKVRR